MTSEPNDVECPRCAAKAGDPCVKPDGRLAPGPHKARREFAAAELEAALERAEREVPAKIVDEHWRSVFVSCFLEIDQRGDWTSLTRAQLESMIRKMAAAEDAAVAAEEKPVVRGSTGQDVANPLFAIWVRLDSEALRIAKALKITPDSRGGAPIAGAFGRGGDEEEKDNGDELDDLDADARRRREAFRVV